MGSLMDYLLLAIGVYVLINAIRGKGKLFEAEGVKEGYEEKLPKTMRALYLPMGILMVINGALSIVKGYFYEQVETQAATETTQAVYGWALKEGRDLGSFSFLSPEVFNIVNYVCMGLVVALVVVLIVVMRKMTDRAAAAAARQEAQQGGAAADNRQAGHILPVSAFDFDEPEDTQPETAQPENKD